VVPIFIDRGASFQSLRYCGQRDIRAAIKKAAHSKPLMLAGAAQNRSSSQLWR
jgi:hypothetical protein